MVFVVFLEMSQFTPLYNNPNQYVNQGYHNMEFNRQQPFSPTPSGAHVIPIRIDGSSTQMTPNNRGPTMQSPVIIQRWGF